MTQSPSKTSVFILAAGRGERMRPLTDTLPKPLLNVAGTSLLEHHLHRLNERGFTDIVINIDHLGDKIIEKIGNGSQLGMTIRYSDERATGALETAGGIAKALPLINSERFIVINGDIWTDFDFSQLLHLTETLATIVLANNPQHHPTGDFSICRDSQGILHAAKPAQHEPTYTYSGIGFFHKQLFTEWLPSRQKLAPVLFTTAESQQLGAHLHTGEWFDIGTPERLAEINALIQKRALN